MKFGQCRRVSVWLAGAYKAGQRLSSVCLCVAAAASASSSLCPPGPQVSSSRRKTVHHRMRSALLALACALLLLGTLANASPYTIEDPAGESSEVLCSNNQINANSGTNVWCTIWSVSLLVISKRICTK